MTPRPAYDLFISYRHTDTEQVDRLVHACEHLKLRVFRDSREIEKLESIQYSIDQGLAQSKAVAAWYSAAYSKSRACQWELRHAYIAAQRQGPVIDRLYVVNPEATELHIQPINLRDQLFLVPRINRDSEYVVMAAAIERKVSAIEGSLGSSALGNIPWSGSPRDGHEGFVGRSKELWDIHSALHKEAFPMTGTMPGAPIVQLTGIGGVGKSVLARQYALLFEAAYPGGIFWLRGSSSSFESGERVDQDERHLNSELLEIVKALDLDIGTRSVKDDLRAYFATRQKPYLWIVDDLPSNLPAGRLLQWLAPEGHLGRTIITTRASHYEDVGSRIVVEGLSEDEAYALLTSKRTPMSGIEEASARAILSEIGFHPLALTLSATALTTGGDLHSFSSFLKALTNPSQDELAFASELMGTHGRREEVNIAVTLRRSIKMLGEKGYDYLLIASQLGNAPLQNSLVSKVLATADSIAGTSADRNAVLGYRQAEMHSLLTSMGESDSSAMVHPLVRRAIQYGHPSQGRAESLRRGAIAAFNQLMSDKSPYADAPSVLDPLVHPVLKPHIVHAYHLTARITTPAEFQLLIWLAEYEMVRGAMTLAIANYRELLRVAETILGSKGRDTKMNIKNKLGIVLRAIGDTAEATGLLREVAEGCMAVYGEDDFRTIGALHAYGKALKQQGNLAQAQVEFQQVGSLIDRNLRRGKDEANLLQMSITVLIDLEHIQRHFGYASRCVKILEDVWNSHVIQFPAGNPIRVGLLVELANTWLELMTPAKATAYAQQALADCREMGWLETHPHYSASLTAYVTALLMEGKEDEIRRALENAPFNSINDGSETEPVKHLKQSLVQALQTICLEAGLKELFPTSLSEAELVGLNSSALKNLQLKEYGTAEELLRTCLSECGTLYGMASEQALGVRNNLGCLLRECGRIDEAIAIHRSILNASGERLGKIHDATITAAWDLTQDFVEANQPLNAVAVFRLHLAKLVFSNPRNLTQIGCHIRKLAESWWHSIPTQYKKEVTSSIKKNGFLARLFRR
ncbi:MAG: TIR domain-containing protein [Nitrospira sp.]